MTPATPEIPPMWFRALCAVLVCLAALAVCVLAVTL